jgi:hypothetical protein
VRSEFDAHNPIIDNQNGPTIVGPMWDPPDPTRKHPDSFAGNLAGIIVLGVLLTGWALYYTDAFPEIADHVRREPDVKNARCSELESSAIRAAR